MPNRPSFFLLIPISLLLFSCSTEAPKDPAEQALTDARKSFQDSDFNAALNNLGSAVKSGGDNPLGQQAAVLRITLLTSLADTGKQMAEAYGAGSREPAAQSRFGPFNRMRSDYYGIARTRLMDAMQSVMNQRGKLSANPISVAVGFPGFTGGTDPAVAKIRHGQWVEDAERLGAEAQLNRNALARTLSAIAGAGSDPGKGQLAFANGKVDIDPRVYLIELSDNFLRLGDIFETRALNEGDHLRIVHEVVRGNLDAAMKLLAAKPDKDLETRAKKMQADNDKILKKLGG
ncbi:MAG TPA: hypothetical protein VE263_05310 [Candidatus Angelobacter sp.]|nr:hypothetical protein [Candidatus Angelobacter sp.]